MAEVSTASWSGGATQAEPAARASTASPVATRGRSRSEAELIDRLLQGGRRVQGVGAGSVDVVDPRLQRGDGSVGGREGIDEVVGQVGDLAQAVAHGRGDLGGLAD